MKQIKYFEVDQHPKIDIDCAGWLMSSHIRNFGVYLISRNNTTDLIDSSPCIDIQGQETSLEACPMDEDLADCWDHFRGLNVILIVRLQLHWDIRRDLWWIYWSTTPFDVQRFAILKGVKRFRIGYGPSFQVQDHLEVLICPLESSRWFSFIR